MSEHQVTKALLKVKTILQALYIVKLEKIKFSLEQAIKAQRGSGCCNSTLSST
jgi:hypothetical protein